LALSCLAASSAVAILRDTSVTVAPSLASITAARVPTGPVPPRMTAFLPFSEPLCASQATQAAAVVFEPLESSITDTRKFEKNFFLTALNSVSPSAMLLPPMKMAVFFLSFGARVKIAPSTIAPTLCGCTPP